MYLEGGFLKRIRPLGNIMNNKNITPPTYLLIAMLLEIALGIWLPVMELVPSPWILLGLISLTVGVVIDLRADRVFHMAGTTVNPFKTPSVLVTDGLFRWTRNPMYLGFVFILIGVAVLLGSLSPYIIVIAFTLIINEKFINLEEQKLAALFGIQWEMYKQRTRRWL
jgi:protein-S-isoprenylcysteine O-methyltransferase Ste14